MRSLKAQFFFSYGILGCLGPLLPVFLREVKGLDEAQIGMAMATVSAATLLSPSLLTLLADTRLSARQILSLAFASTSAVLALLLAGTPTALTLFLMAFYGISMVAILPLQDGLFFTLSRQQRDCGEPLVEYPTVRVWGTAGFILPALLLWPVVHWWHDTRPAIAGAAIYAAFCVVHTLRRLPAHRMGAARQAASRMPTADAFRVLAAPHIRFLSLGLIVSAAASITYHYFFPIYLREQLGLASEWIPLIINLGVVIEVLYTLGYGHLQRWLGIKGIIVCGLCAMILRLTLLAHFPSLATALLVQVGHGLEILALFVTPVMFLNSLAGDSFRNSMQGAFSMMLGASRLVGSLAIGWIARENLLTAYHVASFAAIGGMLLVALGFRLRPEATGGEGPSPAPAQPEPLREGQPD